MEAMGVAYKEVTAKGSVASLLFLDLDRFKNINDTLGHAAGDELLLQVADRLGMCLGPRDVLARLGGDEFTVLLPAPQGRDAVLRLADRILLAMDTPVELAGQWLRIRPSIGAALLGPGGSVSAALHAADGAMYAAKTAGGGRVVMADDVPAAAG